MECQDSHASHDQHEGSTKSCCCNKFILQVCQQPKRARTCGNGEKTDRRPIDPVPVIKLRMKCGNGHQDIKPYGVMANYFCHATLVAPDLSQELLLLPGTRLRYLIGNTVSSVYNLIDPNTSQKEAFFVFPDICLRGEGMFRFKFTMYEMVDNKVRYCQSTFTDLFYVYSGKKFPGMEQSTTLSKSFVAQGIRMRIRHLD